LKKQARRRMPCAREHGTRASRSLTLYLSLSLPTFVSLGLLVS
jgi:hypothetical protein